MQRRIATGLVAGLIAGIAFTLVALFLKTSSPDGGRTSMLPSPPKPFIRTAR